MTSPSRLYQNIRDYPPLTGGWFKQRRGALNNFCGRQGDEPTAHAWCERSQARCRGQFGAIPDSRSNFKRLRALKRFDGGVEGHALGRIVGPGRGMTQAQRFNSVGRLSRPSRYQALPVEQFHSPRTPENFPAQGVDGFHTGSLSKTARANGPSASSRFRNVVVSMGCNSPHGVRNVFTFAEKVVS